MSGRASPAAAIRRAALTAALGLLLATPAAGEATMRFDGRVEASSEAVLSSRLNGVIAEILFRGGERVEAGAPLIRLDPVDAELDLAAAEAALAEAEATLALAEQDDARARALQQRDISTVARAQSTAAALKRAEAGLALAEVDVARARKALERTVIRSPIAGVAAPPTTALGAFVEAEAGPPLGRVVALDPAIVAYRVPYETRLALLATKGAPTLDALLDRIVLTVTLPAGAVYPHRARPGAAAPVVDPSDGTIAIRATLPNPDTLLRPGMAVVVTAEVLESPSSADPDAEAPLSEAEK